MRILVLFTRDLRVSDHPALSEACREADEVVPLFVVDPALVATSPNRARFLFEGLRDLDRRLGRRFGRLIVRSGDVAVRAAEVARSSGCDRIHVTTDVTATANERERRLRSLSSAAGIECRAFPGNSVIEPGQVTTKSGGAYRVFSPYHRAWEIAPRRPLLPEPDRVPVPDDVRSDPIPDPGAVRPDASDLPPGGESDARRQLDSFLRVEVSHYGDARNDLAADQTSRLSPYLRFGFVSANEVVARASELPGAAPFVRQVAWRDFFRQLVASDRSLTTTDQRPAPPVEPPLLDLDEAIERWRTGTTGLPLVDAGMRQLLREGWMHNRARLVTASYLTRRLGVRWQVGAAHFARYLVDGDPANNAGGWQWVAGSGTDTKPVRAFNPVRQAERFDPNGDYIRRYVRELHDVPVPQIFAPWKHETLLRLHAYPEPSIAVPV